MNPALVDIDPWVRASWGIDTPPDAVLRLGAAARDGRFGPAELAEILGPNPGLVERVLDWHARVEGCGGGTTRRLERALRRVGSEVVFGLALAPRIARRLSSPPQPRGVDGRTLWDHSVAAALAVDQAQAHVRVPLRAEAFPAALCHDLGMLANTTHELPLQAYRHTAVGERIAIHLGLSPRAGEAIRFHHAPYQGPSPEIRHLALLVALADAVAHAVGHDCGTATQGPRLRASSAGTLGISRDGFEALAREVARRLPAALEILG